MGKVIGRAVAAAAGFIIIVTGWSLAGAAVGGVAGTIVTGGLVLICAGAVAVTVLHRQQSRRVLAPRVIAAPRRLALPAPAPQGEVWTSRLMFELPDEGDEPAEPEPAEPEEAPEPCEGPECDSPLPAQPYLAGASFGDEDPGEDEEHKFCSRQCALNWTRAHQAGWTAAGRRHGQ